MTTWIVGDVHGCAIELEELLGTIGLAAEDRLILCGDLFDKGPDPVGVLRLLRQTGAEAVLGNHDVAVREMGRALLRADRAESPLPSNGELVRPPSHEGSGYLLACLQTLAAAGVLEEAVSLCESLPLWVGGSLPWQPGGFRVVHGGLHPVLGAAGTDERLATTAREFPPGAPDARKWWEQWTGPEAVVFGHDARQGLVQRREAGRVRAIGLDTGCVYGGRLTGWSPELDRFVHVPARRAWHATRA